MVNPSAHAAPWPGSFPLNLSASCRWTSPRPNIFAPRFWTSWILCGARLSGLHRILGASIKFRSRSLLLRWVNFFGQDLCQFVPNWGSGASIPAIPYRLWVIPLSTLLDTQNFRYPFRINVSIIVYLHSTLYLKGSCENISPIKPSRYYHIYLRYCCCHQWHSILQFVRWMCKKNVGRATREYVSENAMITSITIDSYEH